MTIELYEIINKNIQKTIKYAHTLIISPVLNYSLTLSSYNACTHLEYKYQGRSHLLSLTMALDILPD